MDPLRYFSIKSKLVSLVAIFVAALVGAGYFFQTTLDRAKVTGPLYQQIIRDKDLLADIYPPPLHLIEAYLVACQMCDSNDPAELSSLIDRYKQLERDYLTQLSVWSNKELYPATHDVLMKESCPPALEFFKIMDQQLIPAAYEKDKSAAKAIFASRLSLQYAEHRDAIDKLVMRTSQQTTAFEAEVANVITTQSNNLFAANVLAVLIGCTIAFWIIKPLVSQMRELIVTLKAVAGGDLNIRMRVASTGEFGQLAVAINEMITSLVQRTQEIESRNRDIRMLLDAVAQGFFTIDRNGVMSEERSAAVDKWLGTSEPGTKFSDCLRRTSPKLADWFNIGLDEVFTGLMPIEVTIDQLPRRFAMGSRTFSLQYSPVYGNSGLQSIAVVLSDISADVEREKLEAENREMMAIVARLSDDRVGLLEFFHEAELLITSLREDFRDDICAVKRSVHTLKGNCAIFGLDRVASACHLIEDHIAETNELPDSTAWTVLFGSWAFVRGYLRRLTNDDTRGIHISELEYRKVLESVLDNSPRTELASRMARWGLEPTKQRMSRVAEQARSLARRLGKGQIRVAISGGKLRTHATYWAPFWSSFIHAVRNAVDHGLESPEDRSLCGKAPEGLISLRTEICNEQYVISLSDDGRGIDWDKVARVAAERGAPHEDRVDLVEALFMDGISTADSINDISGRGIGMGAIREACIQLGGTIEVDSQRLKGTTFHFKFPLSTMAPAMSKLLKEEGVDQPEYAIQGDFESSARLEA